MPFNLYKRGSNGTSNGSSKEVVAKRTASE